MSHLSTLKLNQHRYGELEGEDAAAAQAHLASCERCSARLLAQDANRKAFVVEPVPQAIRDLAEAKPANDSRAWRVILLMAAAMLLIGFPLLLSPTVPETDPSMETRTKGEHILLEAWLDTQDGPVLLQPSHTLLPGDVLQLKFSTLDRPYVSFGGVDGAGLVELYGTVQADQDMQIIRAPFALQMDKTPGEQRFYALFTQHNPSEAEVRSAILRETAPEGGVLRSLSFQKE